jgi:hypothetical protein
MTRNVLARVGLALRTSFNLPRYRIVDAKLVRERDGKVLKSSPYSRYGYQLRAEGRIV